MLFLNVFQFKIQIGNLALRDDASQQEVSARSLNEKYQSAAQIETDRNRPVLLIVAIRWRKKTFSYEPTSYRTNTEAISAPIPG